MHDFSYKTHKLTVSSFAFFDMHLIKKYVMIFQTCFIM